VGPVLPDSPSRSNSAALTIEFLTKHSGTRVFSASGGKLREPRHANGLPVGIRCAARQATNPFDISICASCDEEETREKGRTGRRQDKESTGSIAELDVPSTGTDRRGTIGRFA
jgi:hypothetical protein